MTPRPPRSTLFPYTTLFRSVLRVELGEVTDSERRAHRVGGRRLGPIRRDFDRGAERAFDVVGVDVRSEEHTSELQSLAYLVCRLLLEKKKKKIRDQH